MNFPWLPETKILLIEEERVLFLRLRRSLSGHARVVEEKEYALDQPDDFGVAVAAMQSDAPPRADDLLLLGLPLELFTIVHFTLPLAAAENLEDAVGYELMRHVPHDLAGLYWCYRCHEEDGRLVVSVTLAARVRVQSYLTAFTAVGLNLSAVFPALFLLAWMMREPGLYLGGGSGHREMLLFDGQAVNFQAWEGIVEDDSGVGFLSRNLPLAENRGQKLNKVYLWSSAAGMAASLVELRPALLISAISSLPSSLNLDWSGFPYSIDLISPQVLSRRRLWFKLEAAAALFLLLTIIGQPLAVLSGKRRNLQKLEKKLAVVSLEADKLSGIRKQNQTSISYFETLAGVVREQSVTIDLLKELTELIPQDTWLDSLAIKGRKIHLQGTSGSATAVVKALEDSPLFKEVHFDSPVVKQGNSETFKIVVDLE
ncbi:MAG: PilN domain-containing protein [Deltaproteobacteria bacterium]|nr:PilN domain-containing protein [Deltaproteobacteria bacterium]